MGERTRERIKIILNNHNSLTWMHVSMHTRLSLTNRYRGSNLKIALSFLYDTKSLLGRHTQTHETHKQMQWHPTINVTWNSSSLRHKLFLYKTTSISVGSVHPKPTNPSFSGSSITDSSDSTSPARKCCSLKGTDSSNMLAIFWSWTCVENPELYGEQHRTSKQVRPIIFYMVFFRCCVEDGFPYRYVSAFAH